MTNKLVSRESALHTYFIMLQLLCSILTPHNVQMGGLSRGSCAHRNDTEHCRVHPPVCIDSLPRRKLMRKRVDDFFHALY